MSKSKADRSKDESEAERDFSDIELPPHHADAILEAEDDSKASDLFDGHDPAMFAPDVDALMVERAVKYPHTPAKVFLTDIKGYGASRVKWIMKKAPAREWESTHGEIRDKLTESVVKRHIDLIAEVQETHITASKLGLAKALELLSKMRVDVARDKHGEVIYEYTDGEHKPKPVYKGFNSKSLLECMQAIEKAQIIYRRALGLPNDEGGLQQILNAVQINLHPPGEAPKIAEAIPASPAAEAIAELGYDDIMKFIEHKRALDEVEKERLNG